MYSDHHRVSVTPYLLKRELCVGDHYYLNHPPLAPLLLNNDFMFKFRDNLGYTAKSLPDAKAELNVICNSQIM